MASKRSFESIMASRIRVTIVIFAIAVAIIIIRLGYLQLINPEKYADAAIAQQIKDKPITPERGTIYDRNGKVLAVSVPVYDVLVEKKNVDEEDKEDTIKALVETFAANEEEVRANFDDESKARFYAAKKVEVAKVDEFKKLGLSGIYFEETATRVYPYGKFAGHVIGHLSSDNKGLSGLEQYFEKELRGVDGRKMVMTDASGNEIAGSVAEYNEPIDGGNIITTIDEVIQHYTETALEQALYSTKALRVMAIVMDPKTGDVLSMASLPDYDPNQPWTPQYAYWENSINAAETTEDKSAVISQMWRNPNVNDVYEPGSPFKVVTAAAGIEEDVVSPDEKFVDIGYREVEDRTIKNWTSTPYGEITFTKAVEESINTYFMEVAFRLGRERLLKYINIFGFGTKTGIQLPGEAGGILYPLNQMGPVELATISFGQGVTATPIQMISAISAIGNDGVVMKPRIVKEIVDDDGNVIERFEPSIARNAVSKETAKTVLDMMVSVVENGGGSKAKVDGYTVAGKTGTAQKPIDGVYKDGYFIATFTAIAPAEDPQLAVLIIIDEPQGNIYGGSVAAPVAQQILSDSLRYLGISPNIDINETVDIHKVQIPEIRNMDYNTAITMLNNSGLNGVANDSSQLKEDSIIIDTYPKPGEYIPAGSNVILYLKGEVNDDILMPDLKGKTLEEIDSTLTPLGIKYTVNGTGKVIGQYPAPGVMIKPGSSASFDLQEPTEEKTETNSNTTDETTQE